MSRRVAVVAFEWIGAVAALVVAVWCWNLAQITSEFGPMAPGEPSYEGTEYSGGWIALAAGLVTVAGLLVIDSVRRLRPDLAGEHTGALPLPEEPHSQKDPGLAEGVGPGTDDHRVAE
ncbi:hypothetical protein [Rhodococcus sp. NPDC049939]|uniref:hypothetical protein n=1 Tax=Rhodococcus sp. NPDC049939 TaxID=3155511 RepID=UPI003402CBD5